MKITVNAVSRNIACSVLSDALAEIGFTSCAIATALNGTFVPIEARKETTLKDGDRLEVLAPMQGG